MVLILFLKKCHNIEVKKVDPSEFLALRRRARNFHKGSSAQDDRFCTAAAHAAALFWVKFCTVQLRRLHCSGRESLVSGQHKVEFYLMGP